MSVDQARRGRPKGSGLDDRNHLRTVTRLLAADPALKPTTAIKSLGITDPSSIRRLRDKLRNGTSVEAARSAATPSPANKRESMRTQICDAPGLPRMSPAPLVAEANLEFQADPVALLAAWYGVGLQAISSTVEAQMAAMESLFRLPHVASALRSQVMLSQHVLAFSASKRVCPRILH